MTFPGGSASLDDMANEPYRFRRTRLKDYHYQALYLKAPGAHFYTEVIRDDLGEILIPDSEGNLFQLIDLCWLMAKNYSIADACLKMNVHPLRFMTIRARHPEVDDLVRYAIELSGEHDIQRATRLVENLTNDNFDVNKEKAKFFVWRGKQRYYRLYGDKHPQMQLNVHKTENYNRFELSSTIRQLEHKPAEVDLGEDEYTVGEE